MAELRLEGCQSRPLIGYLKGLGIFRIVAEQADRAARARWADGTLELRCDLDGEQLVRLLLDDYAPSPVVSPWNGGSGFHSNDRKEALLAIEQAVEPRFAPYRAAIAGARSVLAELQIGDKPDPALKLPLVRHLRRTLSEEALPWLDAAIVVTGDDPSYPPLLGVGGIDGRYDFSNNYAHAVVQCLLGRDSEGSAKYLSAALHGSSIQLQRKLSLGHLSRDSSPTNSPYGEAESLGNPWDLVLAVEGTLLLVSGAARRHGAVAGSTLVAPFTVYSTGAGYGSAVGGESGRAELWLPLWPGWATHSEIANLVRESRAQVGRGPARRQASSGLDFARAAGDMGVARGIEAFERYAILERAGQSSLAVPAGRVSVSPRRGAEALRSIDRWLERVLQFGSSDNCPSAVREAIRRLDRATFRLASRSAPGDACDVLEAMGAVEHALACSRGAIERGMRPLRGVPAARWIEVADDGTEEFAVAATVASLRDRWRPRGPALRDYLHGTADNGSHFDEERRHAVHGNSVASLLAAILARRHLDAARTAELEPPGAEPAAGDGETGERDEGGRSLDFDEGTWCDPRVIRLFAAGTLDYGRILRLLRGLALLDHRRPAPVRREGEEVSPPQPAFDVLALAWRGRSLSGWVHVDREHLGPRPGWAARLASGATDHVVRDAVLRLTLAGLPPIAAAEDLMAGAPPGERLAAALLIPLAPGTVASLARGLTMPEEQEKDNDRREVTA